MIRRRGAIAWFARNPVAANLMMFLMLLGGLVVGLQVRQEVFPEAKLDAVRISVPYPGASPAEVEQGVLRVVEESVRGLEGVDRVTSVAREDLAMIYVELELGVEINTVLADVKNAVDRITSFPKEAERPTVSLVNNRIEVISLIIYGDEDIDLLRRLAEETRDALLQEEGITNVDLVGAPAPEIAIEVPQDQLRANGLTLDGIANMITRTSVELPGGSVKTEGGEVLLRTTERRWKADDFYDVPVATSSTGTEVTLGQIASIEQRFADTDEASFYDGHPAIMLKVYRTGEQTPIAVADRVMNRVERLRASLPPGVSVATWMDWSEIYRQRIDLLLRNAAMGLLLVMLVLGLFLELRLAFWVTMGIPTSFLGALLLMPTLDVSVNMISLFAFIVTLGMVVDDAIVVGENVFELRQKGMGPLEAAIEGTRGVAVPVFFAIATTVAAFSPMLFVPGFSGKMYRVIPSIVISVLVISLLESMFVLPAHLAAIKDPPEKGVYAFIHRQQQRVKSGLEHFIHHIFGPALRRMLMARSIVIAVGIAILTSTIGFVAGGHIPFRFMPDIDGDIALATVEMPYGTPLAETERVRAHLLEVAEQILEENGEPGIVRGTLSQIGIPIAGDPTQLAGELGGGHIASVQIMLVASDQRSLTSTDFIARWRERVGRVAGAERLSFGSAIGPTPGKPINIELSHDDMAVLDAASTELAGTLARIDGVWDVDDSFKLGKPQLDLALTPEAIGLGMTSVDVARQVRNAFYGAEALRQQEKDGRNELRVMVRLPRAERRSIHDVETLLVRTPKGGEMPLAEAATIAAGRSYPSIKRVGGERVVDVTADVRSDSSPGTVNAKLEAEILPALLAKYPGLDYAFGGAQREQAKSMGSLTTGFALALVVIFALLAIPFKSYAQPLIVMTAIPFGIVGAIAGHVVLGYELSMISVMGLVALSGVVVNDSIVLIDAANEFRAGGMSAFEAIHAAAVRRFRPIMLTSSTTFLGLMPMIAETSVQARFLIPMAISLGCGVLFSTTIALLFVPSLYLTLDDAERWFGRPRG